MPGTMLPAGERLPLPLLQTVDASLQAGRRFLVDGVSVELLSGQVLGLVGPNGAGKSTLLRMMAGLLPPTAGAAYVDDIPVNRLLPHQLARRLAWVPQAVPVGLDFSVFDVVLMGRYVHSRGGWRETPEDRAAAWQALVQTGAAHLANRVYSTLSGGERQRVVVARALAQDTKILLLDEPTSSLDLRHQLELLETLKRLARQRGVAVAVALHDLTLSARFCDRLVLMSNGKAVAAGTPEEVLTEENLRAVYGIEALVERHPRLGHLVVTALSIAETGDAGRRPEHAEVQGYRVGSNR